MKKILMITTGGTIASRHTDSGLAPMIRAGEMLDYVPEIREFCIPDTLELLNVDSTNITPEHWLKLAAAIEENYDRYDGFVICHGTDTMAYTAAILSYLIQDSPKPIVITGSQRPIDLINTDAKSNLAGSFLYASSCQSCGVQIVFDGEVILGTRAKKINSKSYHAFTSINYPHLAVIQEGRIIRYIPQTPGKAPVFYHALNSRISILKLIPGMNCGALSYMLEHSDAVILESYGLGGLPSGPEYPFREELAQWAGRNKTVLMTTQVTNEGSHMQIYQVGQSVKKEFRLLEAYDMTLEAAVCKLMWILAQTTDPEQVRETFYRPIAQDLLFLSATTPNE